MNKNFEYIWELIFNYSRLALSQNTAKEKGRLVGLCENLNEYYNNENKPFYPELNADSFEYYNEMELSIIKLLDSWYELFTSKDKKKLKQAFEKVKDHQEKFFFTLEYLRENLTTEVKNEQGILENKISGLIELLETMSYSDILNYSEGSRNIKSDLENFDSKTNSNCSERGDESEVSLQHDTLEANMGTKTSSVGDKRPPITTTNIYDKSGFAHMFVSRLENQDPAETANSHCDKDSTTSQKEHASHSDNTSSSSLRNELLELMSLQEDFLKKQKTLQKLSAANRKYKSLLASRESFLETFASKSTRDEIVNSERYNALNQRDNDRYEYQFTDIQYIGNNLFKNRDDIKFIITGEARECPGYTQAILDSARDHLSTEKENNKIIGIHNQGHFHWCAFVLFSAKDEVFCLYKDTYGQQPERSFADAILNVFGSQGIKTDNIIYSPEKEQKDIKNCGIFSLKNVSCSFDIPIEELYEHSQNKTLPKFYSPKNSDNYTEEIKALREEFAKIYAREAIDELKTAYSLSKKELKSLFHISDAEDIEFLKKEVLSEEENQQLAAERQKSVSFGEVTEHEYDRPDSCSEEASGTPVEGELIDDGGWQSSSTQRALSFEALVEECHSYARIKTASLGYAKASEDLIDTSISDEFSPSLEDVRMHHERQATASNSDKGVVDSAREPKFIEPRDITDNSEVCAAGSSNAPFPVFDSISDKSRLTGEVGDIFEMNQTLAEPD